jgi:hypothetical protein
VPQGFSALPTFGRGNLRVFPIIFPISAREGWGDRFVRACIRHHPIALNLLDNRNAMFRRFSKPVRTTSPILDLMTAGRRRRLRAAGQGIDTTTLPK